MLSKVLFNLSHTMIVICISFVFCAERFCTNHCNFSFCPYRLKRPKFLTCHKVIDQEQRKWSRLWVAQNSSVKVWQELELVLPGLLPWPALVPALWTWGRSICSCALQLHRQHLSTGSDLGYSVLICCGRTLETCLLSVRYWRSWMNWCSEGQSLFSC